MSYRALGIKDYNILSTILFPGCVADRHVQADQARLAAGRLQHRGHRTRGGGLLHGTQRQRLPEGRCQLVQGHPEERRRR